jgi:iron complex transport system substrate-binding protein
MSARRPLTTMTRRAALAGAASLFAAFPARAATPRVATIDWAMLETTLALGVTPVAAAELALFRDCAVEPEAPSGVLDLGLRGTLSYEQLLYARPDLVLISPWYENRRHVLARIAPVESYEIHLPGRAPYAPAEAAARSLGARLGRAAEAESLIAAAAEEMDAARTALSRFRGRPFLVMNLGDSRHFRAFGADSLFGDVLQRLGLAQAWTRPTQFGAYPTVGVEALAEMSDAFVLNVGPTPPAALAAMRASPLWAAMPPIAEGRFIDLPAVNPYGALPAARRFARMVVAGLASRAHG